MDEERRQALLAKRRQTWLVKKNWTLCEASCLIRDVEPEDDFILPEDEEEDVSAILDIFEKKLLERIRAFYPVKCLSAEEQATLSARDQLLRMSDKKALPPYYVLIDKKILNPLRRYLPQALPFPVNEIREIAEKEIFPVDKQALDIPIFNLYHGKEQEEAGDDNPPETTIENGHQEIAPGIELADIKEIFNKANPRYRLPLEAMIRVWVSFEKDPVPAGHTPKQEIKLRLRDEIADSEATEQEKSEASTKASEERMATGINWDKDGNKIKKSH